MSKVSRFIYVYPPTSTVCHRYYGETLVEGEKTACGLRTRPRWLYWLGRKPGRLRLCKNCEGAQSTLVSTTRSVK